MKAVALALSVALLALGAACADAPADEETLEPEEAPCHGRPAPVDEEEIVRMLGRYGFELVREDFCAGYEKGAPAAMYTNIPSRMSEAEADIVFASDSQVWCDLYRRSRFGREMRRTRENAEEEVVLRVLNVECGIYESNPWHVERLGLALKQLPKLG